MIPGSERQGNVGKGVGCVVAEEKSGGAFARKNEGFDSSAAEITNTDAMISNKS